MSQQSPPPQTADEARQLLIDQVYVPVFFQKLAEDYNIRPQTEDEAQRLLSMAAKLAEARERDRVKQAAASTSLLGEAEAGLDRVLGAYYEPAGPDRAVKAAAAQFAERADLVAAAGLFAGAV